MEWKDVSDAIGKFAPAAESLLGVASLIPGAGIVTGPAALAIGAIAKAFGTDPTPDAIQQAISTDPQAALKLMLAEQDFTLKQRYQDIEELKARLGDIQGARDADTKKTQATGNRDTNLYALAWLTVSGFFALTASLLYFSYQGKAVSDSTGVLFMLFGALATQFGSVYQFFFGSSAGSQAKTEMIAKAQPVK